MPARELRKPSMHTLAAMREAHRNGRELGEAEAAQFAAFRRRVWIAGPAHQAVVVESKKCGLRFKAFSGQVGPGAVNHPAWMALAEKEQELLAVVSKLRHRPPTRQAVEARQRKSQTLVERIKAQLHEYRHLGRSAAKAVAAELGITPEYVRRVRNELAKQT